MRKINATLREKIADKLTELEVQVNEDDSSDTLYELFMNGCVGYLNMSDEDLVSQLEENIDFLSDDDDSESSKLLKEAQAEIALHDTLTQTV